ncbi:tetratricopeptide repeat protein [Streptomyces sp. NPDC001928]|uniref:tetratricopeptide repeat protein n=1 Tax=Streptomyces sp. NPDC001928 TaxID=3154404 RepID=UPI00332F8865
MPRLSRAKKREQKRADTAASVAAPIDVHVPVAGPGAGGASIGGVPVTAAPGEEIQHVVLTHLQRIALAAGHAVHATVHDERIGYVVPLLVEADGSSRFTAEPVRTAPPPPPALGHAVRPALPAAPAPAASDPAPDTEPHGDRFTQVLRPLPGPAQDPSPTFRLRPLPEPVQDAAPGTVAPPLGEFGPPPRMGAPADVSKNTPADAPTDAPIKAPVDARPEPKDGPRAATLIPVSDPAPLPVSTPAPSPSPVPIPVTNPEPHLDPDPKPTPPRGFDAVAEAVLGEASPGATADASPFAESMARINEAVTAGRTVEASELVERTVAEASAVLGPEHPEVLRIRELGAYIAYLAGDPERAFALSLDVARRHHGARDAEAAYGSLHGAATAWRAVRDPALGLRLGRDLLGLWAELTTEGGPAADDVEELESARARMDRLAARAAKSAEPPRS